MSWTPQREEEVFHAAFGITSSGERLAYLGQACGGDRTMIERIQELLAAVDDDGGLLGTDDDPEAAQPGGSEHPGMVIDRYRLERQIGEGAVGIVFEAQQLKPFRKQVALKIIKAGMDSKEVAARFNSERQLLAMLDHPNVARVLDGGTTPAGRPFFVMELLLGKNLVQFCDEQRLPLRQRLELFIAVCQGVQHAHQRGIIHRDIKAGNVMVSVVDEKPVPVVIDFGVAKAIHQTLDERTLATRPGQYLGTPSAMSPEQISGTESEIDTRTDVYALGALLYELLTGTVPFPKTLDRRTGWLEIQRTILEDDPQRPSQRITGFSVAQRVAAAACRNTPPGRLAEAVRGDLDWIVVKTLEKDRKRRYGSVGELIADIQCHLDFRPVSVAAPRLTYVFARFVRRNRTLTAAATIVVLIALAAATITLRKNTEIRHALERSDAAVEELELRMAQSARELLDADRVAEGLPVLADIVRRRPRDSALGAWLVNELTLRNFPKPIVPPLQHPDAVYAAHFSPDGRQLLTTCRDNAARVFDTGTGQLLFAPLQHDSSKVDPRRFRTGLHALSAAYSRGGGMVATASCDRSARVWNAKTGEALTPPLKHPLLVSFAIFSPDDRMLVTGCEDGLVRLWNLPEGTPTGIELKHDDWVNCAEFSPDGRWLLTGADDNKARLWDWVKGEQVGYSMGDDNSIQQAKFSPDGTRLLTVGASNRGILWELPLDGKKGRTELGHKDNVPHGNFSPDGKWIATASFDKTVRVWTNPEGRLHVVLSHEGTVRGVQFSADSRRLLTASEDGTAVIWDVETGTSIGTPLRHQGVIWSATFSPSRDTVATASADGTAALWDVRPGNAQPVVLPNDDTAVGRQDWSPDGRWVVTTGSHNAVWSADDGSRAGDPNLWLMAEARYARFHPVEAVLLTGTIEGFAEVWPFAPGKRPLSRVYHGEGYVKVDWSADGRRFITAADDRFVRVWNYPEGTVAEPELAHSAPVKAAQYSPDGRWIAVGLSDGTLCLWDAQQGKLSASWKGHSTAVEVLGFSANSQRLITTSQDDGAAIWTVPSGKLVGSFLNHREPVTDAAITADGKLAITASRDGSAQIWVVETGRPRGVPLRHRGAVLKARVDRQDRHVVTTSENNMARVWDLNTGHPITPWLRHKSRVRNAQFSPDGSRLLTASDGNPRIWTILRPNGNTPEWLPALAENLAKGHVDLELPETNLVEKAATSAHREYQPEWEQWRSWFFADRLDRPHAPGARISTRQLSSNWLNDTDAVWDQHRAALVGEAMRFQPASFIGRVQLEAFKLVNQDTAAPRNAPIESRVIESYPPPTSNPFEAWALALRLITEDRFESALRVLDPFSEGECEQPLFWFTKAQLLVRADRPADAKLAFAEAVRLQSVKPDGHLPGLARRNAMILWAHQLRNAGNDPEMAWFTRQVCGIPPRPLEATAEQIDLSAAFNGGLRFPWFEMADTFYDFSGLPLGITSLNGIAFDVRGIVQLAGSSQQTIFADQPRARAYLMGYGGLQAGLQLDVSAPTQLVGISVPRGVRRIHVLMTTHNVEKHGEAIARLVARHADGSISERRICYGSDVRTWITDKTGEILTPQPAWIGDTHTMRKLRLYVVTWTNEREDAEVSTFAIVSEKTPSVPIILAVTIER